MLISYLVPVYNVENYISTCLDSILRQQGADFEVVLLDDGSTDRSGAICDEYAARNSRIRVIHKANEGLLLTRRRGFAEARGDWFVCVDSDDYVLDNHLQTIADTIRQQGDCDLVMFDYLSCYPDGHTEPSGIEFHTLQTWTQNHKQAIYEKRLLTNKYNNMWSKAIRRDLVDFDTDYGALGVRNMCEDAIQSYALYTRAAKIVYVPQALYAYRRSIASITANVTLDYWKAILVSIELGWKYVQLWAVSEATAQAYGARCVSDYCDFLTWLLLKSDLDEASRRATFQTYFLDNPHFDHASQHYRPKYLATIYLRLRNPLLIRSIRRHRSYDPAIRILKAEQKLRRS